MIFLLFKIGFFGGAKIFSADKIFLSTLMVVGISIIWTFLVFIFIDRWGKFSSAETISLASHFGSVSMGTFAAAIYFLEAMNVSVGANGAIWLAMMEFPAIGVRMFLLKIKLKKIFSILKKDWKLIILPLSIFLGSIFGKKISIDFNNFLEYFFVIALFYFLFEIGQKAAKNLHEVKEKINSIILIGIAIPIIGGFFGASIGVFLKYNIGNAFILSILLASASYVLVPLCMQEFIKIAKIEDAKKIVTDSTTISIGITFPFNVLFGLELYFWAIKIMQTSLFFAGIALVFPFFLATFSFFKKNE